MSNILLEVNRVREIMGLVKEQESNEDLMARPLIAGTVYDSEGTKVPNAQISLLDGETGNNVMKAGDPWIEITNEEGYYSFYSVDEGKDYTLWLINPTTNDDVEINIDGDTYDFSTGTTNITISDYTYAPIDVDAEPEVVTTLWKVVDEDSPEVALSGVTVTVRQVGSYEEFITNSEGEATLQTAPLSASVETSLSGYITQNLTFTGALGTSYTIYLDKEGTDVASELPISGCTDPSYNNFNPDAVIDDGSCEGFSKTVDDLEGELKTQWQNEVKKQLDIVGDGDIYGFEEAYRLQNTNKMEAVLIMLRNLLCVSARVAKALLLTKNKTTEYTTQELLTIADSPGIGEGHLDLVDGIKRNLKLIDKSFKWGLLSKKKRELSSEIDDKIEPIKAQLNRASDFIDTVSPYVNWNEEITFGDGKTFRAKSTHDILMNSKNKKETIINCAQQ